MTKLSSKPSLQTILLASHNQGKVKEYEALFLELGFRLITADKLGIDMTKAKETAETFEGNALIKARYAFKACRGAYPVMADDSGICFTALDGFPGVHSARWNVDGDDSYTAKNNKILSLLKDKKDRSVAFKCVIVLIDSKGEHFFKGEAKGETTLKPIAAGHGFGYDPIFFSPELNKTFAEATMAEKDRVSHRGKAVALLADYIKANGLDSPATF